MVPAMPTRRSRSRQTYKADPLEFRLWLPRTRQCIFNAWTIPEYIELWSNTEQDSDVRVEADLCAGMLLLVAQRAGVTLYRVEGVYVEFEEPSRIVLTWEFESPDARWDSVVQVDFEDVTDGTVLKIAQSNICRAEHREMQERWWQPRLERMKTLLS
jgi:uncharacterized protein YndB with AHSA1/START domain